MRYDREAVIFLYKIIHNSEGLWGRELIWFRKDCEAVFSNPN